MSKKNNYKVYVHINKTNGKRYYGITCLKYVKSRWKQGNGYKENKYFTRAINKYGWNEGFEHIVLFDNLTKEEAELLEQMYIALYDTTNPKYGYNIALGGKGSNGVSGELHPMYGKHISDETRRKLSEANIGKKLSEETKRKIGEAGRGRKHTEETKKN